MHAVRNYILFPSLLLFNFSCSNPTTVQKNSSLSSLNPERIKTITPDIQIGLNIVKEDIYLTCGKIATYLLTEQSSNDRSFSEQMEYCDNIVSDWTYHLGTLSKTVLSILKTVDSGRLNYKFIATKESINRSALNLGLDNKAFTKMVSAYEISKKRKYRFDEFSGCLSQSIPTALNSLSKWIQKNYESDTLIEYRTLMSNSYTTQIDSVMRRISSFFPKNDDEKEQLRQLESRLTQLRSEFNAEFTAVSQKIRETYTLTSSLEQISSYFSDISSIQCH